MRLRWGTLLGPATRHFRTARARRIKALFPEIEQMEVLDLGGSLHFWAAVGEILKPRSLTILNIAHDGQSRGFADKSEWGRIILYDGKQIPLADQSIDLIICNSVIEHVPLEERQNIAAEIQRVARNWIVQTPAAEFPIEPHFVAPFIHWLPRTLGRLISPLTPFALVVNKADKSATDFFDEIHLLTRKGVRKLFPLAALETERFLGMPKSYLAYFRGLR